MVDGDSANWALVFAEHLHILTAFVVNCALVHGAVEGSNVVVISVSLRKFAAFDIDIMNWLTPAPLEIRKRVLSSLADYLGGLDGHAEFIDIPNAHHSVTGVRDDIAR